LIANNRKIGPVLSLSTPDEPNHAMFKSTAKFHDVFYQRTRTNEKEET
jgi:hypothetical protein